MVVTTTSTTQTEVVKVPEQTLRKGAYLRHSSGRSIYNNCSASQVFSEFFAIYTGGRGGCYHVQSKIRTATEVVVADIIYKY